MNLKSLLLVILTVSCVNLWALEGSISKIMPMDESERDSDIEYIYMYLKQIYSFCGQKCLFLVEYSCVYSYP